MAYPPASARDLGSSRHQNVTFWTIVQQPTDRLPFRNPLSTRARISSISISEKHAVGTRSRNWRQLVVYRLLWSKLVRPVLQVAKCKYYVWFSLYERDIAGPNPQALAIHRLLIRSLSSPFVLTCVLSRVPVLHFLCLR